MRQSTQAEVHVEPWTKGVAENKASHSAMATLPWTKANSTTKKNLLPMHVQYQFYVPYTAEILAVSPPGRG